MHRHYESLWKVAIACLVVTGSAIGAGNSAIGAGNLEDAPDRPNLVYSSITGSVALVPAPGGKIVGFTVGNHEGRMNPLADLDAVLPWQVVLGDNTPRQIGSSDLTFVGTREPIRLGPIFPKGLTLDELADFLSLANATTELGRKGRKTFDLVASAPSITRTLAGSYLGDRGGVKIASSAESAGELRRRTGSGVVIQSGFGCCLDPTPIESYETDFRLLINAWYSFFLKS